jgi:hypothetical protein
MHVTFNKLPHLQPNLTYLHMTFTKLFMVLFHNFTVATKATCRLIVLLRAKRPLLLGLKPEIRI